LIVAGQSITNEDLQRALAGRQTLRVYFEELMDEHAIDAWITPSAPGPAPAGLDSTGDPLMNLPWTQSGLPTVTLPSGTNKAGLPFGLQIVARFGQDARLLEWASRLEPVFNFPTIHGLEDALRNSA
jgi:Asp-tRNA(Asn)/Glu-tRNA(Gln) amidotransferase A subunit family amidase